MFVFSKLMGMVIQPPNLIVLALLAGTSLLFTRRARFGRWLVSTVAAFLLGMAVLPWDGWLIAPLERRFPAPAALPDRVDGIVVLGGAIDPVVSALRGEASLNGAAERVTALVQLGRRYPEARLVYSGGSGSIVSPDLKEAPVARAFLASLGFDVARVAFEDQSRNTRENATFSKALVAPKPGEAWLLVTSAAHMPRSVGTFRAAGWEVVPYPVDYATTGQGGGARFNAGAGLSAVEGALHEWLGLAYYRWRGWSDSLYPSP